MREPRGKPKNCRLVCGFRRYVLHEAQTEPEDRHEQDCDTDIGVDIGRSDLFRRWRAAMADKPLSGIHAIRQKKIEKDQEHGRPVKEPLRKAVADNDAVIHFLGFRQIVSEACLLNKNAACPKASGIMNNC